MQWACNINCQIYINSFFPEIKAKQKSVYQHQSLSLSMHEYWLGSFYRWIRLFNHHLVIYIMNVIIQRIPIYFKNLKVCYPSLLALILWLTWTRESYCQIGIHQTWVMNYFYKYSNCPNPRYVPIGPASTVLIQGMFLLAQLQLSWSKVCSYWPSFNCPDPNYVPIDPASTVLIQSMFLLAQLQLSWSKVCSLVQLNSDNCVILNEKKNQLVHKKGQQNRKCSSLVYTNIYIMHLVCTNNSCYIWRG